MGKVIEEFNIEHVSREELDTMIRALNSRQQVLAGIIERADSANEWAVKDFAVEERQKTFKVADKLQKVAAMVDHPLPGGPPWNSEPVMSYEEQRDTGELDPFYPVGEEQ